MPAIQGLDFHLPHVHILGKSHCSKLRRTAFKRCKLFQYVLFRRDYFERLVASFSHQIQSECYSGNKSVYIEGTALENFSALTKADINLTTSSRQCHAVFQFFISDDSKQDSATTTSHIKRLMH